MNDRDSAFSTKLFDMAVAVANGGVNLDTAADTVQTALDALNKQAKALQAAEYSAEKEKKVCCPECKKMIAIQLPAHAELSKTMANTAKVIDETARLIQYTNGKPDSRPEVVGAEWLQALSPERLAMVQSWFNESTTPENGR